MTPKSAPNATQRPIALVTGASAGIGREFSLFLAEKGYDLVVVARREDRLVEIKKLVAERYGVRAMVIAEDLSHAAAPRRIADIVRASNSTSDGWIVGPSHASLRSVDDAKGTRAYSQCLKPRVAGARAWWKFVRAREITHDFCKSSDAS
jgi:NAD(P)-dependent dehydrogenase (short-subunit alcohol dehydrogenase family)